VRLQYRKVGPARFIGTRELTTVFLRAARRAGLPVAFSQGHHPLPRFSFGPALPLGFSSDDEYLDLELTERLAPEVVMARLAAELPAGLEPRAMTEIPRSAASIESEIAGFFYEVDLTALDAPPDSAAVAAGVARFAAAEAFPVRKRGRRGERAIDARRAVRDLVVAGPHRLRLEVLVEPEGTLKPGPLLGVLLELPPDTEPLLRVHKLATRFHGSSPDRQAARPA
jgi:radical SAM-linked protein